MTPITDAVGRTARRTAILALPLLLVATGTVAAHGGGSGATGGGRGFAGGALGVAGLLWTALLVAVTLALLYAVLSRVADAATSAR